MHQLNQWLRHDCTSAVLALGMVLGGCSGANSTTTGANASRDVEEDLRTAESVWHGTPYKPGGVDLSGVDPVSFVRRLYEDLFDLELPRTASRISQQGTEVRINSLQPGDILLFKLSSGPAHIGIYLGRQEFAHVSVEEGVTVDRIDASDWREQFYTARRLQLPGQAVASEPERSERNTTRRRTGW